MTDDGKVALITGATSGIGLQTARRLHADGFTVVLTGRNVDRGRAAAGRLGERAAFIAADLTEPGSADRLVEQVVAQFNRLHVTVNNAAVDHTGDLLAVPDHEVRNTFETNTFAAIAVLQASARAMTDSGGSIINITSRLASIGVPTMAVYSASKGALKALTTAAAVELAPLGIRVNAVAPGMTSTPLYEAWLAEEKDPQAVQRDVLSAIPLGRLATPADVAAAVSFLASADSAYITGVTLPVDGGYTAR